MEVVGNVLKTCSLISSSASFKNSLSIYVCLPTLTKTHQLAPVHWCASWSRPCSPGQTPRHPQACRSTVPVLQSGWGSRCQHVYAESGYVLPGRGAALRETLAPSAGPWGWTARSPWAHYCCNLPSSCQEAAAAGWDLPTRRSLVATTPSRQHGSSDPGAWPRLESSLQSPSSRKDGITYQYSLTCSTCHTPPRYPFNNMPNRVN